MSSFGSAIFIAFCNPFKGKGVQFIMLLTDVAAAEGRFHRRRLCPVDRVEEDIDHRRRQCVEHTVCEKRVLVR